MAAVGQNDTEGLWDFALRLYARPGVADACLHLQDRHGADVPLLLFAAWLGAQHRHALSDAEASRVAQTISAWHQEVVRPLRAVRRWLKHGSGSALEQTDALRELVKSVELRAERIELEKLETMLSPSEGSTESGKAVRDNMMLFLLLVARPPFNPDSLNAVDVIAKAACEQF